jgi:histone H3/H4
LRDRRIDSSKLPIVLALQAYSKLYQPAAITMASQAAAAVILDSVVIKILHAHSFARTSSQATSVISNLLSRYLVLVASACGQYAELAGRSKLSVHDLIACLGELGTNPDELSEYMSTEGVELSRYASSSAKRLDDLADMRGMSIFVHFAYTNPFCRLSYRRASSRGGRRVRG